MQTKQIEGFEGYFITDTGLVLSTRRGKAKVMKHWLSGPLRNYPQVDLCNGVKGEQIKKKVSQLVATAFIPNPDNKPFVCHKDDNPSNNNASNLFWGTHQDNMDDMHSKKRHPTDH
jgi:hypothetical protein